MALCQNPYLKYINLSKNALTDDITYTMLSLLEESSVEEIYLHWNTLRSAFGNEIYKNLVTNKYVRVLDLSNNLLGKGEWGIPCIPEIC